MLHKPTEDELKQGRAPRDLKAFMLKTLRLFDICLKSSHVTKEEKFQWLNDKIFKNCRDEIYPLACYATYTYPKNDVLVWPCVDYGKRDGEIKAINGSLLETVEVTLAIEGEKRKYQERLHCKYGCSAVMTDRAFKKRFNQKKNAGENYEETRTRNNIKPPSPSKR